MEMNHEPMRQSNQARYDTLQELIKYCQEEMNKCEGGKHTVIVKTTYPGFHGFELDQEVEKTGKVHGGSLQCKGNWRGHTIKQWVPKEDLEDRSYLNTDRFNAFKEMKEKLEKL